MKKMTAEESGFSRLSGTQVTKLNEEVSGGSIPSAMALARDALEYYIDNKDLLKSRRDFIFENEKTGNRELLGVLCLISAHFGDFEFCRFWLKAVEDAGEPYFGYELYQIISSQQDSDEVASHFLKISAENGYLPARKETFRHRVSRLGPFVGIAIFLHSIYLSFVATLIFVVDSKDRRLPRI